MIKNLNQRKKETEWRFDESFSRTAWLCRGQDVDYWWSRKQTVSAAGHTLHDCRRLSLLYELVSSLCPKRNQTQLKISNSLMLLFFSSFWRHVFLALSEVSFAPFVQVQGSDFRESTHGGETWRNPTQSDVAGIYFRMAVWVSGHDRSSLCPVHCKTNESQNRVNSSLNSWVFLCLTKVM